MEQTKTLIYIPTDEEKERLNKAVHECVNIICANAKTIHEQIFCLIVMQDTYEEICGIKIHDYKIK